MLEIRFHGRGGQGAVTSAELLAHAAIAKGRYAQAMPSFGPERRGAPVVAFARVADTPVKVRSAIKRPDVLVVLDGGLLQLPEVLEGLKEGGTLVVNSSSRPQGLRLPRGCKVAWVDATAIAREVIGRPITNTTMLGALLRAVEVLEVEDLKHPLEERFGRLADRNFEALKRAYNETRVEG